MVSTYTPNINLEEPARGDKVVVWDTPVNNNETLTDLVVGAIATIGLNNAPVVLAAAQFQSRQITFNSTLTGSVAITFPSTFKKSYEIQNLCTGSSAFVITLATTVAGGQAICCPPGETIDCFNDGTNLKFKNLGRIGSYWDYAGSSVPAWVDGCSVPPYLNCTGGTFSATTYPILALTLGSTTLPDSKGRFRATLNQASGRITSSQGGVDGNTNYASGGTQTVTLGSSNLPSSIPYKDSGHTHTVPISAGGSVTAGSNAMTPGSSTTTSNATIGITINPSTAAAGTDAPVAKLPPTYIGGLTLIRAA